MEILYFAHGENCFSFIYDICCKQKINVVLYKSPCFISSFYKKISWVQRLHSDFMLVLHLPLVVDAVVLPCWWPEPEAPECPCGGVIACVSLVEGMHIKVPGELSPCCTSRVTGAGIYLSWG